MENIEAFVIPVLADTSWEVYKQTKMGYIIIALLAVLLLVTIILGIVIIKRQKRIEKMLKELTEARTEVEEDISRND